jgi:hypothetical protein
MIRLPGGLSQLATQIPRALSRRSTAAAPETAAASPTLTKSDDA